MKLSRDGVSYMRQNVIKKLEKVPDGKRLHIDKKMLECLLFDIHSMKLSESFEDCLANMTVPVKFLVWGGKHLSKIDLSEIDFSSVMWDIAYTSRNLFVHDINYYEGIDNIDISNTNAKIDLARSFDGQFYIKKRVIFLRNCNFENTDLSHNKRPIYYHIENTDLSYTDLNLRLDYDKNVVYLRDSSLRNINLNDQYLSDVFFESVGITDFSDSGVNINLTTVDFDIINKFNIIKKNSCSLLLALKNDELINDCMEIQPYIKAIFGRYKLGKLIKTGKLDNCFINGKKINTKVQLELIKQEILDKCKLLAELKTYEVCDEINRQIELMRQ